MPIGEIGEKLGSESPVDLTHFEIGADRPCIRQALAAEQASGSGTIIDGDDPHGAMLLLPQREGGLQRAKRRISPL